MTGKITDVSSLKLVIGIKIATYSDNNSVLRNLTVSKTSKAVFTNLNKGNSLQNKLGFFCDQIKETRYILMISETKIDDNFLIGNFFTDRFSTPFRLCCMYGRYTCKY